MITLPSTSVGVSRNILISSTGGGAITIPSRFISTISGTISGTITVPVTTNAAIDTSTLATLETFVWDNYTTASLIPHTFAGTASATSGNTFDMTRTGDVINIGNSTTSFTGVTTPIFNKNEIVKEIIKSNFLIKVKSRCYPLLKSQIGDKEEKARNTLRDMITEREWRRYLVNGFIMVNGESGYWYQIFNSSNNQLRVYKDGKVVNRICIHTDKSCPPTDHVINMKTLIELDEMAVWRFGNVYATNGTLSGSLGITWAGDNILKDNENLLEKYKKLKNLNFFSV